VAAVAIATLLRGGTPAEPRLVNLQPGRPGYSISVAGVYRRAPACWPTSRGGAPQSGAADFRELGATMPRLVHTSQPRPSAGVVLGMTAILSASRPRRL
jgi:hypothetical protein